MASSDDRPKRILLTTFGSLGDLHPYLAIARGLLARGHHPIIATSAYYRPAVESLGIAFHPIPPDKPSGPDGTKLMRDVMDLRRGPETVIRKIMMPGLKETYAAILAAAMDADLLISHVLTYATPLVAEKLRKPWLSTALQPLVFFSAEDPPILAPAEPLRHLRPLGPAFHRVLHRFLQFTVRHWSRPVKALRQDLGLPPAPKDPLFDGQFSPFGNLCLFSRHFAEPQSDWPAPSSVVGFPFFDARHGEALEPELERFLDDGPAPIVFTLGSAAVMSPGRFFDESTRAAKALGRRAVLLIGEEAAALPEGLTDDIRAFRYAPFSGLFPRASVIVHQGGIGTTAQGLRSGRPVLVVPFAHDQPDNADRIVRLGTGLSLPIRSYTARTAVAAIERIQKDRPMAVRAAELGRRIAAEDAVAGAVAAVEEAIARHEGR